MIFLRYMGILGLQSSLIFLDLVALLALLYLMLVLIMLSSILYLSMNFCIWSWLNRTL